MATFDSPTSNMFSIQDFCNASDGVGDKTYILTKIIAGYDAVFGHECMQVKDFSIDDDNDSAWNSQDGWNWQVPTQPNIC